MDLKYKAFYSTYTIHDNIKLMCVDRKQLIPSSGFTVIELLVAIFIMTTITTVVIANYPRFGNSLAVKREAQLAALTLRDAEQRAIFTQAAGTGTNAFQQPYGVHFDLSLPDRYVLFADSNNNGFYDGTGTDVLIETVQIGKGAHLYELCDSIKKMPQNCGHNTLSITFKRPAPFIQVKASVAGTPLSTSDYEIKLQSTDAVDHAMVVVWTTGAISVEAL